MPKLGPKGIGTRQKAMPRDEKRCVLEYDMRWRQFMSWMMATQLASPHGPGFVLVGFLIESTGY